MAYLRVITRASRNYEGSAWATFDVAYRRQAANRRSLDWAEIDPVLYNEAFTGRAKLIPRCRYCLADNHGSQDCAFAPEQTKSIGRTSLAPVPRPRPPLEQGSLGDPTELRPEWICCLYNRTCVASVSVGTPTVASNAGALIMRWNAVGTKPGHKTFVHWCNTKTCEGSRDHVTNTSCIGRCHRGSAHALIALCSGQQSSD